MNKYLTIVLKIIVLTIVVFLASCKEKDGQAPEYMPDMYRSPSIETYVDNADYGNPEVMSVRKPVEGTIPRGFVPYENENTQEGYEASATLLNPVPLTEENVKQGQEVFKMFCVHCHGKKGQGDGILVERGKFPAIPTKFTETLELPAGKMFHTITYGKGLMGSHASQLNQEERWKVIHYIEQNFLKKK